MCGYNDHIGGIVTKMSVGSRELKTRLGTYLRKVRQGQTLVITERGRPVAELRPISFEGSGEKDRMEELVVLGLVSRQSDEELRTVRPVRSGDIGLAATILEGREDRF
jgi:prevent-host-death family protein